MRKKYLFGLLLIFVGFSGLAQESNYSRGYKNGFKEGYCYNDLNCIAPIAPVTPVTRVGEDINNYQDGYNRGFKDGGDAKSKSQSNGTKTMGAGGYQPSRSTYQSQYVPQNNNAELMIKMMQQREAAYTSNQQYIDNLIDWIYQLKSKTDEKEFLDAMDLQYKKLRAFDGTDLSLAGDAIRKVELNIKEEIDKYNTRLKEAPTKLWKTANEKLSIQNYTGAIEDFTKLIGLNPTFPNSYCNRGYCYKALGNLQLALNDFNTYLLMSPQEPIGYDLRGWTKYQLSDYTGALSDFNKQIELNPENAAAYYNRGSAKSALNDELGAIKDYTKAIELNPNYSMAYNNRGWSKFELKKYKEALVDLDKAIQLDANNYVAYDSRQETKFMLNDLNGCISDCNAAIKLNPKLANSYFFRGRAYYRQGNKEWACEEWSKAGELGKSEAYEFITKYCK